MPLTLFLPTLGGISPYELTTPSRNRVKGQEISKAIFLATPLPKKQTKFLKNFCPSFFNGSNQKKLTQIIILGRSPRYIVTIE